MKNIFLVVGSVLLGLSTVSCSKGNTTIGGDSVLIKRFITHYLEPKTISVNEEGVIDNKTLVAFSGSSIDHGERYEALAEANNDHYNRVGTPTYRAVFAEPLNGIKVITKSDFDSRHPAGSDVADIVECDYETYYKYVHSGFTGASEREKFSSACNAIGHTGTQLMEPVLLISFGQKPTTSGTYKFDLIFTFANTEVKGEFAHEFK